MKKNIIILLIASTMLAALATRLTYLKIQSEPKKAPITIHKIIQVKKEPKKINKPKIDYGIHFINENEYPYFKKYKQSVMPFISSQYPTNFEVDITLTNVKIDNWKMQIFYNAKITESNYYSYTQHDLNYTCNVRKSVPIPSASSYSKTDSTIIGSHYSIPAGTSYLTVNINGNSHIQFLVSGSGECNIYPTINKTPTLNQEPSNILYNNDLPNKNAPYIYSIIDSDGMTNDGFINAGAKTLKYTLSPTPILMLYNKQVNVPANTKIYYYPSVYSKVIVSTNNTTTAKATKAIQIAKNKYMYLIEIQGQEGWIILNN